MIDADVLLMVMAETFLNLYDIYFDADNKFFYEGIVYIGLSVLGSYAGMIFFDAGCVCMSIEMVFLSLSVLGFAVGIVLLAIGNVFGGIISLGRVA